MVSQSFSYPIFDIYLSCIIVGFIDLRQALTTFESALVTFKQTGEGVVLVRPSIKHSQVHARSCSETFRRWTRAFTRTAEGYNLVPPAEIDTNGHNFPAS
jgi:hypothetical protein